MTAKPRVDSETRAPVLERLLELNGVAYQLAVRVLGAKTGAEDVVQQAYVNAIGKLPDDLPPDKLRSWFLRVVANAARTHLRSEARRKRREAAVSDTDGDRSGHAHLVEPLRRGLDALEEKYRLPIALCFEQGLSQAEAGEVLGTSQRTVSGRVSAGLEKLRKLLNAGGYAAPAGALTGGLRLTAPEVPSGLAAAVEKLIAGAAGGKAAIGAGSVAAAGGLTLAWKILAGLSLATILGTGGMWAWKAREPLPAAGDQPSLASGNKSKSRVTATVTDHHGKPVPGVTLVFVVQAGTGKWLEVTTGSDGRISADPPESAPLMLAGIKLPPGQKLFPSGIGGDVEVSLSGSDVQLKPDRDGRIHIVLKMKPPDSRVVGRVTDTEGKPVAGAEVTVTPDTLRSHGRGTKAEALLALCGRFGGANCKGTTGKDGTYSIPVPVGRFSLRSVHAGGKSLLYCHRTWRGVSQFARPGGSTRFNARMDVGGGLEITVTDPDGKLVPGAVVRPRSWPSWMEIPTAGKDGIATLYGARPGVYLYTVTPPEGSGLAPLEIPVRVERGKVVKTHVALPVGATVSGRVLDEQGQPIAGVKVNGKCVSGKNGGFALKGLATGDARLFINVREHPRFAYTGPGGRPKPLPVVVGGAFKQDLVLRRLKPAALTGRVTDPDGKPVAGVAVSASFARRWKPGDDSLLSATTEADGKYRLVGLVPGEVTLSFVPPRSRALNEPRYDDRKVKLEPGENRRDFRLQAATVLTLTLRDAAGRPVPGIALGYSDYRKSPNGGSSGTGGTTPPSDAAGKIELRLRNHWRAFKAGEKRVLEFRADVGKVQVSPREIELKPRDGQVVARTLTVKRGARLDGSLVDAQGKPVAWAGVTLRNSKPPKHRMFGASAGRLRAVTASDGMFNFDDLPAGEYTLDAELLHGDDRNLVDIRGLKLKVGSERRTEKKLVMQAGGTIEGWVLSHDGKRLRAAAKVDVPKGTRRMGGSGLSHVCDPQLGEPFRLGRLPPGKYKLTFSFTKRVKTPRGWGTTGDRERARLVPETEVEVKAGETTRIEVKLLKTPKTKEPPHEVF